MNPSADEMLELAKRVYPDKRWIAGHSRVYYEGPGTYDFDEVYFDPSLTGEDWQVAQACRVIVAATRIPDIQLRQLSVPDKFDFVNTETEEWLGSGDLLQAAISALLANSSAGGKP